jgi:D-serine deaminase-like pyridoxal phosphate-dependent protein
MAWDLDAIDTPALVVDLDVVERNLTRMQAAAERLGLALWPHTKTHKSPLLAERQMALGAAGLTVAKLGEAEVLRAAGFTRLFVHYPILGDAKVRRLADLAAHGGEIRVAVDSVESIDAAAEAAQLAQTPIAVLIEVDTGMHRVGRPPGPEVVVLARHAATRPGLVFRGLTSYAGHIGSARDEAARQAVLREEGEALNRLRDALAREGLRPQAVSVGGSHHAARMDRIEGATEIRPGTYVYNDRNTLLAGSCREADLAASVLVTVVSRGAGWAVVDGGSKAFSSDPSPAGGHGLVLGRPGWQLERMSEEHGIVTWPAAAAAPAVGERLRIVPNHVCATVNLHDEAYGVRGGRVDRMIAIAGRGRMR